MLSIGLVPSPFMLQVQKMANETGLDFSDQIISLENKYQQVKSVLSDFLLSPLMMLPPLTFYHHIEKKILSCQLVSPNSHVLI